MELAPTNQINSPANKMTTQTKASFIRDFTARAGEMVNVEHLAKTIREGMRTDIAVGDIVISTCYYDAGVFVVDPLHRIVEKQRTHRNPDGTKWVERWEEDGEEISNPYPEIVKDNDPKSRSASLSVKCKENDEGSRTEMRVKVKKLCLMRWDEETQSYPRMSQNIIFRSTTMDFAEVYKNDLNYYTGILTSPEKQAYLNPKMIERARTYKAVLERLALIPPFPCFYDEKYGFLIKRELRMSKIVYANEGIGHQQGEVLRTGFHSHTDKAVDDLTSTMEAQMRVREASGFNNEIVEVAMNPDRVESIVEKFGIDAVEKTFG
jgi:hypothetical protein